MTDSSPTPETSRLRLLLATMPGIVAFSMGQTALFSVAGPVFREIGLGESQLGLIISSAAAMFVVSSTVWGRIIDRWGRRPTILFGLLTYGSISLLFAATLQLGIEGRIATAELFIWLLLIRLMFAAFGAGIQPASVALMADHSAANERAAAVAMIGAGFGIGMVLGPASSALLVGFGVLVPLYAIAVLGLFGMLLAFLYLPHDDRKARLKKTTSAKPLRVSTLLLLLSGSLLVFTAMSTLQQTLAFNLQDMLQTDSEETVKLTGLCFVAIAFSTLAMQVGVIQRFKPAPQTLLLYGVPMLLIGFIVYSQAASFTNLLIASMLLGIGFGLTTPGITAAASVLADASEQGRIAGILQSAAASGFIIGPIAGTTLYEIESVYAAYLATVSVSLALGLVGLWLFQHRDRLNQI
ncbi:MAG: MFS transporter [Gammaproteobacteria bacterium]|nr:MFS transporter [Gammaproteobacteria bacterium]